MSACVNCGQRGFKDVDGSECQSCGFKKIATRELAPAQLIFCVDLEIISWKQHVFIPNHPSVRLKNNSVASVIFDPFIKLVG